MGPDDLSDYVGKVDETVAFLRNWLPEIPEIFMVLGTGLSTVADLLEERRSIPYSEIPNFPRSTVASHSGFLVAGRLAGRAIVVLQGRFHFYEGYSARQLTLPVRVMALLGAKIMMMASCAGGLNPSFSPGALMVVTDHLNFMPENPLRGENPEAWGPRFPDLSAAYDRGLADLAAAAAADLGISDFKRGVYCAVPGPSLETPAETRFLRNAGGDAVGMSTVPEVIVARHGGLKVLVVALIANVNDPDNFQPISLDDVIREASAGAERMAGLLAGVVARLESTGDEK